MGTKTKYIFKLLHHPMKTCFNTQYSLTTVFTVQALVLGKSHFLGPGRASCIAAQLANIPSVLK